MGGMFLEGILAFISLSTAMILTKDLIKDSKLPTEIFSLGVSHFVSLMKLNPKFGLIFGYLAISAFILTTLDTATRISRYVLQELLDLSGLNLKTRILTSLISLILPVILLNLKFYAPDGTLIPAWKKIWPLFGSTNQLLAALVLLTIYVWAKNIKAKKFIFILIPNYIYAYNHSFSSYLHYFQKLSLKYNHSYWIYLDNFSFLYDCRKYKNF